MAWLRLGYVRPFLLPLRPALGRLQPDTCQNQTHPCTWLSCCDKNLRGTATCLLATLCSAPCVGKCVLIAVPLYTMVVAELGGYQVLANVSCGEGTHLCALLHFLSLSLSTPCFTHMYFLPQQFLLNPIFHVANPPSM